MDLHQLRCFIAVAEELNFGRAAARLHMTQPPLSRQIQLLEKSLGGALFERNNRHVQLTHMGQHLLTESRLILKLADRLESSVQQCASGEIGTLSMGFTAVFARSFIPQLLKALSVKLPGWISVYLSRSRTNKLALSKITVLTLVLCAMSHPTRCWRISLCRGRHLSPPFTAITRWHASEKFPSAPLTMSPFSLQPR